LGDFLLSRDFADIAGRKALNRKEREENHAKDAKKIALASAARVCPWVAEVGN
jgi:hypothetical protein